MDSVEIIFLDAGGTLLYPHPEVGEVYARAGRRHGIDVDPGVLEAAFRAAFSRRRLDSHPQDREWWRGIVSETFSRFGEATDSARMFDEIYDHFSSPRAWRLFPDAIDTLAALRARGYRTGLVSNWDDRLPGLLEGLGLLPGLDPLVVSCRVGAEKPDPLVFEVALAEAGVAPPAALMVGDDPVADVEGARAVGMRAVLVDRRGGAGGDGPAVEALAGLLDLLPARGPGA